LIRGSGRQPAHSYHFWIWIYAAVPLAPLAPEALVSLYQGHWSDTLREMVRPLFALVRLFINAAAYSLDTEERWQTRPGRVCTRNLLAVSVFFRVLPRPQNTLPYLWNPVLRICRSSGPVEKPRHIRRGRRRRALRKVAGQAFPRDRFLVDQRPAKALRIHA